MRRLGRFVAGTVIGGGALVAYLGLVGFDSVLDRAGSIVPWAAALVVLLVVVEGLADGIGVWASVNRLGRGLSPIQSAQFALAGDFFDTLSPAGPVSSEPIMARFIGVATETSYSDALGARTVAKYVKSGTQLLVSTLLCLILFLDGSSPRFLVGTLGGAVLGLLLVGAVVLRSRATVSRLVVPVVAPLVFRISSLYREDPHDRAVVVAAIDRFWGRILEFRTEPTLLVLIALAGVIEQVLTAGILWVALAGTGTTVLLLPIVAVVPLPQVASVVPIPGSLGTYDVLLSGALVLVTTAPATATAAAVLLMRTVSLPFGLTSGGMAVAFLRGWRPS